MREWINICEGVSVPLQIDNGYKEYYALAVDHFNDLADEDEDRDLSIETYRLYADQIIKDVQGRPLYRGMTITQYALENAKHIGIFYSDLKNHSESFARGSDQYDERFTSEFGKDVMGIVIEIEPVALESINIPVTVAMNIFGGEGEIRLFENEPVRIKKITDLMGRGVWEHLWGADYLS